MQFRSFRDVALINILEKSGSKARNDWVYIYTGTAFVLWCLFCTYYWITFRNLITSRQRNDLSVDFDFIIFCEEYPVAYCISWKEESESHKCYFAADKHAWSIHGIWPSKSNSEGPEFCKNIPFNETALLPIVDELQIHWSSIQGKNNFKFWVHEWQKHGTCAVELPAINTERKYFDLGLKWIVQYNISKILNDNQIYPSDDEDRYYTLSQFHNAMKQAIGKMVSVACVHDKIRNVRIIREIRLCFSNDLELIDCDEVMKDEDCSSTDKIYYPETPSFLSK